MNSTAFVRSTTDRPEIGLHTIQLSPLMPDEALTHLVHALQGRLKQQERMLVFFNSCDLTDAFAEKNHYAAFHSNLPASGNTKAYNLDMWDRGETTVMACTSAFASGVDRPNIRFVVIYKPRYGLMTIMQMAGRAGRDGTESHVFFATPEKQGPSFPNPKDTQMTWELGQLIHEKTCKVYQSMFHMDGETLAQKCSDSPMQVPCDICCPDGEMQRFALDAVKNPGRPLGGEGIDAGKGTAGTKVGASSDLYSHASLHTADGCNVSRVLIGSTERRRKAARISRPMSS